MRRKLFSTLRQTCSLVDNSPEENHVWFPILPAALLHAFCRPLEDCYVPRIDNWTDLTPPLLLPEVLIRHMFQFF